MVFFPIGKSVISFFTALSTCKCHSCLKCLPFFLSQIGAHDELIQIPYGAYNQLVSLQQVKQDADQHTPLDLVKSYASVGQQLIQNTSSQLSTSGCENHHTSSESFRLPPGKVDISLEISLPEVPSENLEVPLYRLAYLNKPELPVLLLGSLAAVVSGVLLPIFAVILSRVVHTLFEPPSKLHKDSKFWSLMLTFLGLVTLISIPIRAFLFSIAGSKLIKRIRSMSFDKIVHMEVEWFDKPENSTGAIGARLAVDAAAVRNLVGDTLALLVQNVSTLVAGLAIALLACWQLALLVLALVPLIGLNGWIQLKFTKGLTQDAKVSYAT